MLSARALRVPRHGDVSVLTVDTIELPEPRPGQALVEVAASGVNFIDIYQRKGIYPVALPFTLGLEGAGTVVAVGPDTHLSPGDRVAWAMRPARPPLTFSSTSPPSCRCLTTSRSTTPPPRCSRG